MQKVALTTKTTKTTKKTFVAYISNANVSNPAKVEVAHKLHQAELDEIESAFLRCGIKPMIENEEITGFCGDVITINQGGFDFINFFGLDIKPNIIPQLLTKEFDVVTI